MIDRIDQTPVTPITAAELRARSRFPLTVAPGIVFLMRRLDMVAMLMEGIIPLSLLGAVSRLEQLQDLIISRGELALKEELKPEDQAQIVELVNRFCCAAVVQPRITMTDTGEPDAVPVSEIDFDIRLAVLNAVAPQGLPSGAVAATFPGPEPRPAADAGPVGTDVLPAAVVVDPASERDVAFGIGGMHHRS